VRLTKDKKLVILSPPRSRSQWIWSSLGDQIYTDLDSFFENNIVDPSEHEWRTTWPPHTPNFAVSQQLKLDRKSYKKFAVVRNPWERFVSFYLRLRKVREQSVEDYAQQTGDQSVLNQHAMTALACQCNFEQFIIQIALGNRTFDLTSTFNFLLNNEARIDVDYLFKFDDTNGIRNFFKSSGYVYRDISLGAPKRNWRELHTPITKKAIESMCELEIRYFGFSFN
jgi:hypothetical protein